MRKHALLLPLTLSAIAVASGPTAGTAPSAEAVHQELFATREAVWRAWFQHDEAALRRIVTKDLIAIGAGMETWEGLEATVASSERFVRDGGKLLSLTFPKTEVQRYGDVAIVYSLYAAELERSGKRSTLAGRATEVFVRRGGRWEHPGWHLDMGK